MTDDLDDLLSLIDEPGVGSDEIAAAEARVWARLSGDVRLQPVSSVTSPRPVWTWYATAAVIVLSVVGLVAVIALRDQSPVRTDTPPTVTALDRPQACERFRDGAGSLVSLLDDAATGDGVVVLNEAVVALEALATDLAAAGMGERELADLAIVRGGVQQAALHASVGDTDAAIAAIEFARRSYAGSDLARDDCLG